MDGQVRRLDFDIEATGSELIFSPTNGSACIATFQIEVGPRCEFRDLVFVVRGKDFDGVCARNPGLSPSASLEGAYAYSPNARTGPEVNLGPIQLAPGDHFAIETWHAGENVKVMDLINFVGLVVNVEGGSLVRRLV